MAMEIVRKPRENLQVLVMIDDRVGRQQQALDSDRDETYIYGAHTGTEDQNAIESHIPIPNFNKLN